MKRLTAEMHDELRTMNIRTLYIKQAILPPLMNQAMLGLKSSVEFGDPKELQSNTNAELKTFKVRLENILCETDKKALVQTNEYRQPYSSFFYDFPPV